MGSILPCFKAYDVRGRVPDELDEDLSYRIGRAYAQVVRPRRVVVGRDIRLSSEALATALSRGLTAGGADVLDIGRCGTEMVYFATFHLGVDGGIMVTASHNPRDYNGMKLVRDKARPISGDTGLGDIESLAAAAKFEAGGGTGKVVPTDILEAYVKHLLGYVDPTRMRPLKVVTDPGHGGAGPIVDLLAQHLPLSLHRIHHEPDGSFPAGVPNPLLPENRKAAADAVKSSGADLGLAWDGDFDRCFLFDERAQFIEGYYIVGLLASRILARNPGAKIIHDPRLTWNTIEMVSQAGGVPVMSKTGHAFIKERMRAEDAVYGGEMSAHHYFREFSYCDSGMIPWLLVAEELSITGKKLSELIEARMAAFPASGEINRKLPDPARSIARVQELYLPHAESFDRTDGISLSFGTWRFNLRSSNTEPVVRLNVESRGDAELMRRKTQGILEVLGG
ncbi:MAG TPA: phosphomannomutase CpsG [Polyangiaceae bacterium]|nr:phosphomannomutase CpsG [Polyangiaceae bacterium]